MNTMSTSADRTVPPATNAGHSTEESPLLRLLALDQIAPDRFRGNCHEGGPGRAYGGHMAALALAAGARTVESARVAHSMHGYFIRSADPLLPVHLYVDRLRDGGRYTHRRVTVTQDGSEMFSLLASFKLPSDSLDKQGQMPASPDPDTLADVYPTRANNTREPKSWPFRDILQIRPIPLQCNRIRQGDRDCTWFRVSDLLGDDPSLHATSLVYMSDLMLAQMTIANLWTDQAARRAVRLSSLDHSVWFHRPFRADEWLMYVKSSNTFSDGRGLAHGEFWSRDGRHVASITQEVLGVGADPTPDST